MNSELDRLAAALNLSAPESKELALKFSFACVKRVEHLLEDPEVVACLEVLERYVNGNATSESLLPAAQEAALLANRHRGSKSIDGCGHAAVSASYGVAKAVAGKALEAAQYSAYALVYASGGYAAVADRDSFQPENGWQVKCLKLMATNNVGSNCKLASNET